jgi:hypothetical protein
MTQVAEGALFREVQRFRQWWVHLIILGVTALMWYGFIVQIIGNQPFGNNPAPDALMWLFWVFFGLGFPLFWYTMNLTVEVHRDHIRVRFFPFATRRIAMSEIQSFEARQYNPIMEYGGWGIRFGWGERGRAYNVSGNLGVQLVLTDDKRILIGTQQPDEFVNALDFARKLA